EGGGGQFDLAAVLEFLVQGQDLTQNLQVLVQDPVFFRFGEIAAFGAEVAQVLIALKFERVYPGQVEPDLQVAEVPLMEAPQGLSSRVLARSPAQVQLKIARERPDHGFRVGHEKMIE